jgi:poly-gamma-glutamate synthesis protein (capsule biosynthesis protein)
MVARRTAVILAAAGVTFAACSGIGVRQVGASPTSTAARGADPAPAATVILAGDAMLGRGVAPVVAADPDGILEGIRRVVRRADVAAVNVESPLTERPHASANPHTLEADPASATLLASAGFDVAGVANNHAGDAGRESVIDTRDALGSVGIRVVGGGKDLHEAWEPVVVDVRGIRVAFLAIDGSSQGVGATPFRSGIALWERERAMAAVATARVRADVVIVGLHGGIEYWSGRDPLLTPLAHELASWGVDVVWGHGPHVGQPITVEDPDGDGRSTVVATSLGNLVFDQLGPDTREGLVLELLVDGEGVIAHRVGTTRATAMRVAFEGWRTPDGAVAMLGGTWWSLDRPVVAIDTSIAPIPYDGGQVVAAGRGDLDGDGSPETLISFRHPVTVKDADPFGLPPTDAEGRSAHLGVLDGDGTPLWLSRRPPHPVGAVMACDGTAVFAYTSLDDSSVIATGAGTWSGFGFVLAPELGGPGSIGCADVDHDGRVEPVVMR